MAIVTTRPTLCIALLLIALLTSVQTGCLTEMAIKRWRTAPLESARLEVIEARGDSVRLRWKASYRGAPARSGKLQLNPNLPSCDDVRVLIRDRDDLLTPPRQREGEPAPHWAPPKESSPFGDCDVVVVVARTSQDVALSATSAMETLAETEIEAPHNHLWLAVIPMAVVGDAAAVVAVIPLVLLNGLGQSDTATTWTWTP